MDLYRRRRRRYTAVPAWAVRTIAVLFVAGVIAATAVNPLLGLGVLIGGLLAWPARRR